LSGPARADEATVRPEVGRPLQAAQELIRAGKYKEAIARLKELDAVPNKTAQENFVAERMRGAALAGAGDAEGAAKSLEAVIAANRLPAAEQLRTHEALVGAWYRARDYAKAVAAGQRYLREGGSNPQIRTVIAQAQYLTDDFAGAAKALRSAIEEDEKAGRTPAEEQLQLLASCHARLNDNAGYVAALEKLIAHHPKKGYWPDILARIQRNPGFSDRYALDVYRLKFAAGAMRDAADYVDMAQLALQSGEPAESRLVVEEGFSKGVLGTGSDGPRHARLRDLTIKQLAADAKVLDDGEKLARSPDALARAGYALVMAGQADKGLALMERARDAGGFRYPGEAALHLAQAYRIAGKKDKAIQAFKVVEGKDGAADLARLWLLLIGRQADAR